MRPAECSGGRAHALRAFSFRRCCRPSRGGRWRPYGSAPGIPGQPFFLYLALTAPHTPWLPQAEFRGKSKAGDYGDFVAQVDDTVGQVMRVLEQTGLADNTLLILPATMARIGR